MTSRNSPLTKAVLLAAGRGARMKGLTSDLPKPMIPVAGTPVLERILSGLTAAGIRQFLIVTGYKADVIRSHFGDGSRQGIAVTYAHQIVQDGTGRVVELAREFTGQDSFLLGYGDILVADTTYSAIQDQWTKKATDGILTVKLGEDLRKGAVAVFDREFNLCELVEKPGEAEIEKLRLQYGNFKPWYNAGIYVFTPRIFDYTARLQKSVRGEYELPDALRHMARDGLKLTGFVITDQWMDVRDSEALARADRQFGKQD